MARDDGDVPWYRQLVVAAVALVVVAIVVGLTVGAVMLGAVRTTGLDTASPVATEQPSVFIPSGTPTTSPNAYPVPRVTQASPSRTASTATGKPTTKAKKKTKKKARTSITLRGFPRTVPPGGRINLAGSYAGGEGTSLQVQQFNGGWGAFPVNARVSGGTFSTYVITSATGRTRFRMLDPATSKVSNPVTIRIG